MSTIPTYRMTGAAQTGVARTYNLMADHYDDPPLSFWDRYGRRTVERMGLPSGGMVLDVGCGSGAATLPAAELVGANGYVIGVDLSDALLARAQRKADARQMSNVVFQRKDMTSLSFPDQYFDAVVSVFSIFFVDDIEGLVGELWRMVKPGGKLAITTWAPPVFEPLDTLLRVTASSELPNMRRMPTNMDRVASAEQVAKVMRGGGATNVIAVEEYGRHDLPAPEDWWTMALGSGLRRIIASLDEEGAVRVRERMLKWVRENAAQCVSTNVVYAVATK